VLSFVRDRSFIAEFRRGVGLEFGVYDRLEAGVPARYPLFTMTSGAGESRSALTGATSMVVEEFDSLAVP